MKENKLQIIIELHKKWLIGEPGGVRANLYEADLSGADLSRADLDFSVLPLWCGSLTAHFDDKQLIQLAYHLVKAGLNSKNASDDTKEELKKLIDFANRFHRVDECGKIEGGKEQ